MNTKRHKHADLIHAWAEGAEMPVEPECVTRMRRLKNDPTWDVEWTTLRYIDSLREELKRIREAEMPVEPKVYQQQFFCDDGTIESHEAVLKHDYNALKAYAQRKDAENEALRKLLKDVRARAVEAKLKEKNT